MKHFMSLAGFLVIGLSACGVNESFSAKTFDTMNEFVKVKGLSQTECSSNIGFENLSLEQLCWDVDFSGDFSVFGDVGLEMGLAMQDAHDGELEIIEKSESAMVIRQKTKADCANYLVFQFNNAESLDEVNLPTTIELGLATTKKTHCGGLSKTYDVVET